METAVSWERAAHSHSGLPEAILSLFNGSKLGESELLLAVAEHKVPLRGTGGDSQCDVWALVKASVGMVSLAIEAKAAEPFGSGNENLAVWLKSGKSPGSEPNRMKRWEHIQENLPQTEADAYREVPYQILQRCAAAVIEARRFGLKNAAFMDFDGLRHFIWVTYWQSNIDLLPKHFTTLLVGHLLGPAEAGLLRLAREIASALSRPALLIRQVVFTDLTRAWNEGSATFDVVAYRTALLGGALGIAFVALSYFFGEYLLGSLLGTQFIAAKGVLTLMLLAATLDLASSPLLSGLYAMGHAMKTLRITMASTAVYLLMFVLLTRQFGLIGAGLAATTGAALTLIGMIMLMRSNKRAA